MTVVVRQLAMTQGLPTESPCFFISVYGIVGITVKSVEELAKHCSGTLHTLDVNGCVNVKVRILIFVLMHNDVPESHSQSFPGCMCNVAVVLLRG
jgi:hypothetical protein